MVAKPTSTGNLIAKYKKMQIHLIYGAKNRE
jgi:hypothetical protein